MAHIPLNGESVLEKVNDELQCRKPPATVLREALSGIAVKDAPDVSNGATESEPAKAVDPSQGHGYPGKAQRPDPLLEALLKTVY